MANESVISTDSPTDMPLEASFHWLSAAAAAVRTSALGKSIIVFLLGGLCGRIVEHVCNPRPTAPAGKPKPPEKPPGAVRLVPIPGAEARELASDCPVCLHDFDDREPCCRLPCSHIFHRDCINRWIARGSRSCPICRMDAASPAGAGLRHRCG